MKLRNLLIAIIFVATTASLASAQTLQKATAAQSREMIATVNKAAATIKTIQCDFTQTKTMSFLNDKMVSKGKMHYASEGNRLRWEYTTPYRYTFVISGGKVTMRSKSGTSTVNLASNRLFQNIANIMAGSVTGKCLSSSKDFNVEMYATKGGGWVAQLTPKRGELKKMFKQVRLYFNASHTMVSKVQMVEAGGDTTIIELTNVKTNAAIPNATFSVK